MTRMRIRQLSLLLLLLLFQAGANAAGLTDAQVRSTLAALQELEATFGSRGEGASADLRAFTGSPADTEQALVILDRHGFASIEEWTTVTRRVVNAYMAVKFVDQQPDAEAEMARARAEIEASDMSPEQKVQMLAMMEQTLAAMSRMADAPSEDVATVRRMLPELDAYFEEP